MRADLYRMLYPLEDAQRAEWAGIVKLPEADYLRRLSEKAEEYQCRQESRGDAVAWVGTAGNPELFLFRIPDPSDLGRVRRMYELLAAGDCPLAYAFVNQRGDSIEARDVFQLSRLSYLCHCNRLSGPGSECPN
jgi:hypothetical protein